ncbi:DNA methylase [Pseudoalteromonas phage HS1]|uniref:site-specific DNA-methyltransferase n=1 Tax=Pseudoalteromonas phage HS5 TaxID=1357709 RepID=UPI002329038D|nr:site-specific DNA-methyltransferase [Pseudoalteromonas phage HS5]YP_010660174.1 DNA methylase [Pseudoalteromonas phage HS1]
MINLMQGDCLERMKEIPSGSVDMILTDPPYGMDFQSNFRNEKHNKINGDNDLSWLDSWVDELFRVAGDNTAHYVFVVFIT